MFRLFHIVSDNRWIVYRGEQHVGEIWIVSGKPQFLSAPLKILWTTDELAEIARVMDSLVARPAPILITCDGCGHSFAAHRFNQRLGCWAVLGEGLMCRCAGWFRS